MRRKPCCLIANSRLLTKAFTPTPSLCLTNKSSISQASEECKLDHIFEVLGLLVGEGLYKSSVLSLAILPLCLTLAQGK